jgi:hypothetical protein
VPDEDARVEVYRYVNPRAAQWPKADFIVGNPPFIGDKAMRERLGEGYLKALFSTTKVPESADFVMHWWDKAAVAVESGQTRRFGFITTNSLPQKFNRRVLESRLRAKSPISIAFAIPNHPWIDETDGASVRIAMTVGQSGTRDGLLLTVLDEAKAPDDISFSSRTGIIHSDLTIGAAVVEAQSLRANADVASNGCALNGAGFILDRPTADTLVAGTDAMGLVVKPYRNGRDLTGSPRLAYVIDLFGYDELEVQTRWPASR